MELVYVNTVKEELIVRNVTAQDYVSIADREMYVRNAMVDPYVSTKNTEIDVKYVIFLGILQVL